MASHSLTGSKLANRFLLIEPLGEGAMAEVYLAEHEHLGRRYAIKVLKSKLGQHGEMVERFRREARAASRLDHPNIVHISDFGQTDDGRFYLVMDYTPGRDLYEVMQDHEHSLLPLPRAIEIFKQILRAVGAAHQGGVIHRDLKPENVLLTTDRRGNDLAKILDFGLAKSLSEEDAVQLTQTGEVFGTPVYMAPEQARGEAVDFRSDIYSVGILGYELVVGRPPFVGKNMAELLLAHQEKPPPHPDTLRPEGLAPLPKEFSDVLLSCLSKKPGERPAAISEVSDVIEGCLVAQEEAATTVRRAPLSKKFAGAIRTTVWGLGRAETQLGSDVRMTQHRLGPQGSINTEREWRWGQIAKQAKILAQALREELIGPVKLSKTLVTLVEAEDQVLAIETEIALLSSQQEDLDSSHRERVAQLRHAVIDLSFERERLGGEPAQQAEVKELDHQIGELEQRLATVYAEHEQRIQSLDEQLESQRAAVAPHIDRLRQSELDLVRELIHCRPDKASPEIESSYQELQALLNAWH